LARLLSPHLNTGSGVAGAHEQKAAIVAAAGGEVPQGDGANDLAATFVWLAQTLGPGRILALGAVACCLLGFFAYVIARATEASYTLLFSGLELADAQELVGRLEAMAVPFA
jgi:hypothetical protein